MQRHGSSERLGFQWWRSKRYRGMCADHAVRDIGHVCDRADGRGVRLLEGFLIAVLLLATFCQQAVGQQAANRLPPSNAPLVGCVEGRAVRIVNGAPSCASTAPPTLTGCGASTIDATATDFIGQVSMPAGLTSCTIVMTKLYPSTFICLLSPQTTGIALTVGSVVATSNGSNSTLVVPFGLTLSATKFGYICGPG